MPRDRLEDLPRSVQGPRPLRGDVLHLLAPGGVGSLELELDPGARRSRGLQTDPCARPAATPPPSMRSTSPRTGYPPCPQPHLPAPLPPKAAHSRSRRGPDHGRRGLVSCRYAGWCGKGCGQFWEGMSAGIRPGRRGCCHMVPGRVGWRRGRPWRGAWEESLMPAGLLVSPQAGARLGLVPAASVVAGTAASGRCRGLGSMKSCAPAGLASTFADARRRRLIALTVGVSKVPASQPAHGGVHAPALDVHAAERAGVRQSRFARSRVSSASTPFPLYPSPEDASRTNSPRSRAGPCLGTAAELTGPPQVSRYPARRRSRKSGAPHTDRLAAEGADPWTKRHSR